MSAARDRVLTKAGRMFAASGFDSVSMRDLALELDMQAPSLYSHFPSKEALLGAVCHPYQEALQRMVDHGTAMGWGLPALLDLWRDTLTAHLDAARIVHVDPAVRDLSVGQLGRVQDLRLAVLLESHGVRTEICAPLIAAFRAPFLVPGADVDDRAVGAAGELILSTAQQAVA